MRIRIADRQHAECRREALELPFERPAVARARISNHHDLLPGIDGRSLAGRRFRDLVFAFISDLGGASECSAIKINLIRRLAATTVQSEILESKMALGEPVDVGTLCTLASTAVRISVRLGLERRARDISPSLADIAADIAARRPIEATDDADDEYAEADE